MRKKETSIIEPVKGLPPAMNEHLDRLDIGDTIQSSPYRYRHIETGEEFVHLAGAIAWPGKEMPGYVLVVGVQCRGEVDTPFLVCLEEEESRDIGELLTHAVRLRERHGFRDCQLLFRPWYGDQSRFASLLLQFNQHLQDEHEPEGIDLAPPVGFELQNHFELYLHHIQSLLVPNADGVKNLILGTCNKVRNALQGLPPDAAIRFSDDDCPPVAALGYTVHSIIATQPWTWREGAPSVPADTLEDYERYALAQQGHKYDVL